MLKNHDHFRIKLKIPLQLSILHICFDYLDQHIPLQNKNDIRNTYAIDSCSYYEKYGLIPLSHVTTNQHLDKLSSNIKVYNGHKCGR